MLLAAIRDYLQQRGSASLQDVATHFDIATDTARFALHYWQNKGKVRELHNSCSSGCGGKSCGAATGTRYEWVRRAVPVYFFPK
ncbi:MAG: FeoC-like transcriptional regulator [Thiothrix sp.]